MSYFKVLKPHLGYIRARVPLHSDAAVAVRAVPLRMAQEWCMEFYTAAWDTCT